MRPIFQPSAILAQALCLLACTAAAQTGLCAEDWVQLSNAEAEPVLRMQAKYGPEGAASYGLEGYDEAVIDLSPGVYERHQADVREQLQRLNQRLSEQQHPKVKQDIQILIKRLNDSSAKSELSRRLMLPYYNVPEMVFGGIRALLDPNVATARRPAAVVRLKKYAGLAPNSTPLTELAKQRTLERFDVSGLLGPYRVEVRKDLAKADSFLAGIAELMRENGMQDWEQAHQALSDQIAAYKTWVESTLLPRGRDDHRLPAELYAESLKDFGIQISPQEMAERARFGYAEIRDMMSALAKSIAAKRGWEKNSYRDVIAALKKEQLTEDEILPRYNERLKDIEAIIKREKIVTLPHREARIRLASAAESASIPAPSMRPPRMIGNTGEYGEFIIPLRNPSAESTQKMDDFLHDAITWSLTAHEARPGHEMQFSAMIENGVSIPRAIFAFNSANVEGWGLYSEAVMFQHLPPEGQFFVLYMRLLRAARAFLDPLVNLGEMTPADAKAFLIRELVLSEPMAAQEADRYAFWMPGQAPSYYYGLIKLQALRAETELRLGRRFNQLAFHDFILQQGLLPLDMLRHAVLDVFIPAQLSKN